MTGPSLKKHDNADKPLRAAEENDHPPAEEADQYVKQQIQDLESGRRLVGLSNEDIQRRERAVDNLKALGPAAIPAVPALAWAAVNVREKGVKQKAIELLGEIGGLQGVAAICQSLDPIDRSYDYSTYMAGEDSLLKLLPAVGSSLTMDDAISLWEVLHAHPSGQKRLPPAIESAWEASGIKPAAMANEILRRCRAKHETSKGNSRLRRPPPSPMNWRRLIACDLVIQDGVVNMQGKPPWVLWREAHPAEAAEEIAKAAAQTRESQKNVDKGFRIMSKIQQELAEQERLERRGAAEGRALVPGNCPEQTRFWE